MRIRSSSLLLSILVVGAPIGQAQLTPQQKVSDFAQLASVYAIAYGPAQWKREALGVDLLNIGAWLDKAAKSGDDLDFYEIMVSYVASLNDAHDQFLLPSDFGASLGFSADIYDGKVRIDQISRTRLPVSRFPFQIGDELLSIDGKPVADLLAAFSKYSVAGNPLSTRRFAAALLTARWQDVMPRAHEIGDSAAVAVDRGDAGVVTFIVPWRKSGTPLTSIGPVISPFTGQADAAQHDGGPSGRTVHGRNLRVRRRLVRGFGETQPVFAMPTNFVPRLGLRPSDLFFSGTFQSQGLRLGYLRIPSFDGYYFDVADFENEIQYMQQSTDGLILDITRNPGGDACFAEELLKRLFRVPFQTVGLQIRATRSWIGDYDYALQTAIEQGEDETSVQQRQDNLRAVQDAYARPSGMTPPLPICAASLDLAPAIDKSGKMVAYAKPIVLLVDELSASAADFFAAVMQDNRRAVLFGNRTMGAGGNVEELPGTTYTSATTLVTESLMTRKDTVSSPEYIPAPVIENIGVRPDIFYDFMTKDNLTTGGADFVNAFTKAAIDNIRSASAKALP